MPRAGWLAAGAIGAALAGSALPWPWAGVAAGAVVCAATGWWLAKGVGDPKGRVARRWRPLTFGGGPWLALGAALVLVRLLLGGLAQSDRPPAAQPELGGGRHRAVVEQVFTPGNGQQRAIVTLEPAAAGVRAWITLPRYPAVSPTDRIEFEGRLEPAPPAAASGFGEFLARSGVGWTARARSLTTVRGADTPAAALEGLRRGAADLVARALPEPQAGLAAAMLIGLRDLVARDVAADFRTTGMSHIVAISGYHIALLAAFAGALLKPLARRPRTLLLVGLVAGYAVLAGGSPSVLRAALMACVVLLARTSGRRGGAASALALAVVLLLVVDPVAVVDAGFQLSVAATAGLLVWGEGFALAMRRRVPATAPGWLVEALAISLAAQLATLPLVLFHFGRLSIVSPLANLLAAPLVAPATAASAVALASGALSAGGAPPILLAPLETACALLVGGLITIARLCAGLPLASVELPAPFDLLGAAGSAALVMAALRRRRSEPATDPVGSPKENAATGGRPRAAALLAASAVVALVLVAALARPDGRLHMTVLDVGQGDAILLRGPAGSRLLVDTGPDPERLLVELDARLPAWDRRIDMVVITHPHEDHVAGLAALLDRYQIGVIAEPGMIGLGPGDAAFRRRLTELGRATRILAAGDTFAFDGVEGRVHWPLRGRVPQRPAESGKAVNNVSIVLELRYGARRLLLAGDVEQEIDGQLLAAGLADGRGPPVDVLKVAHHGSATATTDAFLERVRPQVAVISAGAGNPYGHPSPATVARLEAAGAQLFRTDLDGAVEIVTDGHSLSVDVTGGRRIASTVRPEANASVGFCPVPAVPGAPPTAPVGSRAGTRRRTYNRADVRSLPRRGVRAAAALRSAALAARPFGGSRRGGRLPRHAHRGPRALDRSPAGRGGGTAA